MKSIEMHLVDIESKGLCLASDKPVTMKKAALYLSSDRRLWLCDKEKVLSLLKKYGEEGEFCVIGNTEYILIFPGKGLSHIDGETYVIGECVIMKCHKGPECMTEREANEAFIEYVSRIRKIVIGQKTVFGFQMN